MSLTVPTYARAAVDAFTKTGTVPGLNKKVELQPDQAAYQLQSVKDDFEHWAKLDGSPQDKSPEPGDVYVDVPQWQGHQEAAFRGDASNGWLVFVDETPNEHYSARWTNVTHATPDGIDIMSVCRSSSDSWGFGPSIIHLDPKTGTGYELYADDRQS